MTKWKAGDKAVVEYAHDHGPNHAAIKWNDGGFYVVPLECLRPLPPVKTVAEAALVEECLALQRSFKEQRPHSTIVKRIDAVLAERAPPDPVEVGVKMARSHTDFKDGSVWDMIVRAAVKAALEAERDGRKVP